MVRPKGYDTPFWRSPIFALIIGFGVIGSLFFVADAFWRDWMSNSPNEVEATIVGYEPTGYTAGLSSVTKQTVFQVRLPNGKKKRIRSGLSDISDCKLGGRILVLERDPVYTLPPVACPNE